MAVIVCPYLEPNPNTAVVVASGYSSRVLDMFSPFLPTQPLKSDELAMLEQVLANWCSENGVALKSLDAQPVARSLIDWFLFGIKTPSELRKMIQPTNLNR